MRILNYREKQKTKLTLEKECGTSEKNIAISNANSVNHGAVFQRTRAKLRLPVGYVKARCKKRLNDVN